MGFGDFMEAGGWVMSPLLVLGCAAMPLTLVCLLVAMLSTKRRSAALYVAVGLCLAAVVILTLGTAGYATGMMHTEDAMRTVDPEDREIIRMAGGSEAKAALVLALSMAIFPLGGGVALLGLGLVRLPRFGRASPS